MDDDPASPHLRDKEALATLADELLELEGDRDLKHVIVESYETAPNPEDYSNERRNAVRDLEAVNKTIEDKRRQKRRLEQRIQAARNAERQSARDAASGEDRNMWEARNRWGTVPIPRRTDAVAFTGRPGLGLGLKLFE
ncbi:uncharacterized protein ColSpa_10954 [Colletotrichum spaethianum]|uniref:Uncharacterized protein n=1 Tax=Colletotrichum spaethianum TaxID=700344 RepID=A0AA37PEL1_9PEZI|nr:uncharacterized protein ColSpa_10954 [Colletotrichum spaethianum]GKT50773.1 hypothetical protein ColSpa_10954 [Colletotrichum spaethianum]